MRSQSLDMLARVAVLLVAALGLAACQVAAPDAAPIPREVMHKISDIGSTPAAPIYVRIFKEESEFEVWKRVPDGSYALLETYPICTWSGVLGPKLAEGDRQAPEGFYMVTPGQMNPNSIAFLSFNLGFPNAYDTALERTGSNLMVHGGCASAGCYALTDDIVQVIYALAREAFRGGQRAFQVDAFPFRMTPENLARHADDPNIDFWTMLKDGFDHFEVTHRVPEVEVCDFHYVFDAQSDEPFVPTEACPDYTIPDDILVPLTAKQEADAEAYRVALDAIHADAEANGAVASATIVGAIAPAAP